MATPREHAVRLSVLKAISERVEEVFKAAKAEALPLFAPGDRITATIDGTLDTDPVVVGSVTLTKGRSGGLRVSDQRAFLDWVREVRPSAIVESVRKSDQDSILKEALQTGELPPGVDLAADTSPYLTVRPDYAAVARLDWRPFVGALDAPQAVGEVEAEPVQADAACASPGWRSTTDNSHHHACKSPAGHGPQHECECGARWKDA